MKKLPIWSGIVGALLVTACATLNIDLPAVTDTPTGERLPGKVIWRDLLTHDPEGSQRFYEGLFGWEFESVGSAVGLGNIDTAAAKFAAGGGQVITPPTDLQRRGSLAVVRDAEGAALGLLQTRDGDPADREPEVDGFLWDELWTTDVDSATAFYEDVAGLEAATFDVDENQESGATYRLLSAGDKPRVGIMPNPLEDLGPVWVSYLRVESPASITARVAKLGGRVIVEARPRPLGGEVAFIAGPSGAGIALQTWPLEQRN